MLFTTDKQTLDDLNIFGKPGSSLGIFNLFNCCAAKTSSEILEEMFRYPLSNMEAINLRSGAIKYFAARETVFPFQSILFDTAESYLANTDQRTRLSADSNSIGKKFSQMIAPDSETSAIYKGILAVAEILRTTMDFISSAIIKANLHFQAERNAIASLIAEPAFLPVFKNQGKLSDAMAIEYDGIFRFRYRDNIKKLFRYIYQLDVYISVAKVAAERGFIFPEALSKEEHLLQLEDVYHPQVDKAVPNTIDINPDRNVVFLTGANMAGKSTFMKSLSLALYLAHMGFPVAAKSMRFSVSDGIYTTINLPDNLGMGASHFYAEVLRVKKMAKELSEGKNLFIVFDELFRGTNVKDAYEATIAVTGGFAGKRNSMFVISTHIIEAGDVLKDQYSNICFLYLPTWMNGNKPVYTYSLEKGITDDRHGMVIIKNEGILDILAAGISNTKSA